MFCMPQEATVDSFPMGKLAVSFHKFQIKPYAFPKNLVSSNLFPNKIKELVLV